MAQFVLYWLAGVADGNRTHLGQFTRLLHFQSATATTNNSGIDKRIWFYIIGAAT